MTDLKNYLEFVQVEQYVYNSPDIKPLEYGWVMKISNSFQLAMLTIHDQSADRIMYDAMKSVENGTHPTISGAFELLGELRGVSFAQAIADCVQGKYASMSKFVNQGIPVYMQRNGSYFIGGDQVNELTSLGVVWVDSQNKWPILVERPTYLKWPNGTHWYVKVAGASIEHDGNHKWDTKKLAKNAYNEWYKDQD